MSIETLSHNDFLKYSELTKNRVFYADHKDYNLNIWVIRNDIQKAGYFDDMLYIFWKHQAVWTCDSFKVTADPSDISLIKNSNPLGVAIIKPGQHSSFTFGYHKDDKSHPCLRNTKHITVIRDFNGDGILNWDKPNAATIRSRILKDRSIVDDYLDKNNNLIYREHTGVFGTNVHRASAWKILEKVGLYSEGCVVHQNPIRYNKEFIYLINEAVKNWGINFTVTMVLYKDLQKIISHD